MATLSVRKVAKDRLGLIGSFSVNRDLYGYPFRNDLNALFGPLDSDDMLPGSGEPRTRSLKRHLETIAGRATDLVIFLVAHENDFLSGVVTRSQVVKLQYALQVARDIYAQVNLGIRKIMWRRIPVADAGGYAQIADHDEAENLTDDFSGPGGGIDVFVVQSIGDAGGWSAINGKCSKESKWHMSGSVIEVASVGHRILGISLAHEVGHYLGLRHTNSATNLMGVDSNGDGIGEITNDSTKLTSSQGLTMRWHCSVSGPW